MKTINLSTDRINRIADNANKLDLLAQSVTRIRAGVPRDMAALLATYGNAMTKTAKNLRLLLAEAKPACPIGGAYAHTECPDCGYPNATLDADCGAGWCTHCGCSFIDHGEAGTYIDEYGHHPHEPEAA